MCQLSRPDAVSIEEPQTNKKKSSNTTEKPSSSVISNNDYPATEGKEKSGKHEKDSPTSSTGMNVISSVSDGQIQAVQSAQGSNITPNGGSTAAQGPGTQQPFSAPLKKPITERVDLLDERGGKDEAATGDTSWREYSHIKVTHLCSKFNILCAAYEDGTIACWK